MDFFQTRSYRHSIKDIVFTTLFDRISPAEIKAVKLIKTEDGEALIYTCKVYDEELIPIDMDLHENSLHYSADSAANTLVLEALRATAIIRGENEPEPVPVIEPVMQMPGLELKGTEEDLPF